MVVRLRFDTRIPEDRKIVLQLPLDAPIGDVKLDLSIDDQHVDRSIVIPDLPPQRIERSGLVREIHKDLSE